jgi:STE24 endopeptidase
LSDKSPSHQPPPDSGLGAEMTSEELNEAKRYGRAGLVCTLVDKAIDIVYLGVMALLLAPAIDDWLTGSALLENCWSLRLVVLFLIVFGLHAGVSFPLSYYSGHVLEHRFGLSKLTFAGWLWRYSKRLALAAGFGMLMFLGLFWIIWLTGEYWWLAGAGAFFVVGVLLGQIMPVVILPLFYKIERLDRTDLLDRLERLAEGTGLSIKGIYRILLSQETAKANAMLAGLGRTRRVLLGDTLLDRFTPEEIEVVFAHEIGHHVHRHIRKMILAGIVYSAAGFWVCDRLLAAWVTRVDGRFDYASLPEYVYALPLVMFVLVVFGSLVEPLGNTISRCYERQSDRYALDRTGLREAYTTAFRKLSRLNKDDPDPHWLEVLLFHGHPPISERLELAENPRPQSEELK